MEHLLKSCYRAAARAVTVPLPGGPRNRPPGQRSELRADRPDARAGGSAFGLISSVVAVSQSAAKMMLPVMSVGWCSPRYIRDSAMSTGITIAGTRNSHRHQPLACPRTTIAIAMYRQQVAAMCPDG